MSSSTHGRLIRAAAAVNGWLWSMVSMVVAVAVVVDGVCRASKSGDSCWWQSFGGGGGGGGGGGSR
ncbi:hypothetical protein TYRP_017952 [Tyrophagus putrescentiae]|nr:hypothetical protein TYRP_017952 [Tyrophagus putrescentiae]